ncbi:MAG: DUF2339 domain-containing protein [Pseudobdellovibrio sp.]
MESIDSRVKRIEQRLSSIEKFISENLTPRKSNPNYDINVSLGRVSEPVEVAKEYHYDYSNEIKSQKTEKVQYHKVDVAAFNSSKKIIFSDDTVTTAAICSFIVFVLFFGGRFVVDSAWLSQSGQISLAMCTSAILIALGYLLEDKFGNTSRYFPLLGQILLYVGFYGASCFYQVIPKNIALGGILLSSIIGIFQFQKNKLDIYLIVSAIGAYVVPLYISYQSEDVFVNLYFIITSLFFMYASVWLGLTTLAIVGAYLALIDCALSEYFDADSMNLVMFTLGHFIIYASAYILIMVRGKKTEAEARMFSYLFFPFVMLFYLVEFYYINLFESNWDAAFTGAISALFFGFYFVASKLSKETKLSFTSILLLSSGSITLTHTLFYVIIPAKFRPISLVVASYAIFKFLETLEDKKWTEYSKILGAFLFLILGWNYFEVIFKQFAVIGSLPVMSGAVYVAVALYITFFEKKIAEYNVNPIYGASVAHVMVISIIYNLTKNHSFNTMLIAVGGYFVIAVGSLFFIEKKFRNKEQ